MSAGYLDRERLAGVEFLGAFDSELGLVGVMGLQQVRGVALIRHAYTRTARQGTGIGSALLAQLQSLAGGPILVGTWRTAGRAIQFYEHRGFRLIGVSQRETLLRRYWTISQRQIEDSVVLASKHWFARSGAGSGRER